MLSSRTRQSNQNLAQKRKSVYIIAEIGINHNGSIDTAKELIAGAGKAGVDAIKFQYRNLHKAYSLGVKEIGDELLRTEINKNYLSPQSLLVLAQFTKELGMDCGISFFNLNDIDDFGSEINRFDFTKLPSVELTNSILIDAMLDIGKQVYISTGCHTEQELSTALGRLPKKKQWTPLHCISNYPTILQNSRLGYISYMLRRWNRDVGYSSHDNNWEVCLFALQLGATVIERHITLDKNAAGLDHTSSSTPDEFEQLCTFAKSMEVMLSGDEVRTPNQGELLNRQNLGRSYFAASDIEIDDELDLNSLVYCSPNTGLNNLDITEFIGRRTVTPVKKGTPITKGLFDPAGSLPDVVIGFSKANSIAIPVRSHDLKDLELQFPIGAYEFHFSYEEVRSDFDLGLINKTHRYSIHLPDYVGSTLLMDPFSPDPEQKAASMEVMERTVRIAEQIQELCKCNVPVVGSFSMVHVGLEEFFFDHAKLLKSFQQRGVNILLQWLPPIAWYFGGSVELNAMNNLHDIELIRRYELPICMDVCHLIMCRNFYGYSAESVIDSLRLNIQHIHIADARGIDGEGIAFGEGEPENADLIRKSFEHDCLKVIEVWQGHLDKGAGFRKALITLAGMDK